MPLEQYASVFTCTSQKINTDSGHPTYTGRLPKSGNLQNFKTRNFINPLLISLKIDATWNGKQKNGN